SIERSAPRARLNVTTESEIPLLTGQPVSGGGDSGTPLEARGNVTAQQATGGPVHTANIEPGAASGSTAVPVGEGPSVAGEAIARASTSDAGEPNVGDAPLAATP